MWTKLKNRLTAALAVLVAVLGAGWLWNYARKREGSLKDRLEVQKALNDIKVHEARRLALIENADAREDEIAELDAEILESKKRAVRVKKNIDAMTTEEVLEAFRRHF